MKVEDKTYIYRLILLDISNELDSGQIKELHQWIDSSVDNLTEYNEVVKLLNYYDRLGSMKTINVEQDLQFVKKKIKNQNSGRNLLLYLQRIAAILFIPLFIYSVWNFGLSPEKNKTALLKSSETSFGVRTQIELSDGTKVWMNSGSKLIYPDEFTGNVREVKLIGEAYFQVESDKEHPFLVDLNGCKVKATGTRFNISNYPEDNLVTTYLEHGKIDLLSNEGNNSDKSVPLNENEIIVYQKTDKQYQIARADGKKYLGWIDGALIFKNDKTQDVAARLGRWFNAEIIFDEDVLKSDYVFTATFKKESLEEALKLLTYSSPISYKILEGSQQNDSSFSKRKVLISKK